MVSCWIPSRPNLGVRAQGVHGWPFKSHMAAEGRTWQAQQQLMPVRPSYFFSARCLADVELRENSSSAKRAHSLTHSRGSLAGGKMVTPKAVFSKTTTIHPLRAVLLGGVSISCRGDRSIDRIYGVGSIARCHCLPAVGGGGLQ